MSTLKKKKEREKEKELFDLNFVYLEGGTVKMGTKYPVKCKLEGYRKNEVPERSFQIEPFWICKFCVTNSEFEEFMPGHFRPPTSHRDKDPVTDVTFMEVQAYIEWLSKKHRINFSLPSELEWIFATAPFDWEFSYKKEHIPEKDKSHNFNPNFYHTLEVCDERYGVNCFGLYLIGSNVSEMTRDWYYTKGHFGAETDGAYFLAKGGNFGHCKFSSGVQRRHLVDVADRSTRRGFRIVHRP